MDDWTKPPVLWNEQIMRSETRTQEQDAILQVIHRIEGMGAHEMLTNAQTALGAANGWLAAWEIEKAKK